MSATEIHTSFNDVKATIRKIDAKNPHKPGDFRTEVEISNMSGAIVLSSVALHEINSRVADAQGFFSGIS